MFDGNNRAQVFFKQHGCTDGGKIKAKYTSRAADLYREILAKEVAKAIAEDTTIALPEESTVKEELPPRETSAVLQLCLVRFKRPIGAKRTTSKTGGLCARKLTSKVSLRLLC